MLTLIDRLQSFSEINEDNVRYASGVFVSKHQTKLGNYIIELHNACFIFSNDSSSENNVNFRKIPNNLNILVPHRRKRLLSKLKDLTLGEEYCVKMIRESRSGKFACSELFLI